MTQYKNTEGFTLIELMLAMAFVGALLVAIAVTTMQIMGTYTKGLTVREVNQAGRTITEDIQRTIATSSPFSVSPAKTGAANDSVDSQYVTRPGGGRICTGTYTYAWNYGMTKQLGGASAVAAYNVYSDSTEVIRLAKVSDVGGALCVDPSQQIAKARTKELLSAGDRNLAVQELTITSNTYNKTSDQALYAVTLSIGTNDSSNFKVLNPSNTRCLAPKKSDSSGDQASDNSNFCAINQFSIIARAGNRSGSL